MFQTSAERFAAMATIMNDTEATITYAVQADFLGYFGKFTENEKPSAVCQDLKKAIKAYNKAMKNSASKSRRHSRRSMVEGYQIEVEAIKEQVINILMDAVMVNEQENLLHDYEETANLYAIAVEEYRLEMKSRAAKAREARAAKAEMEMALC